MDGQIWYLYENLNQFWKFKRGFRQCNLLLHCAIMCQINFGSFFALMSMNSNSKIPSKLILYSAFLPHILSTSSAHHLCSELYLTEMSRPQTVQTMRLMCAWAQLTDWWEFRSWSGASIYFVEPHKVILCSDPYLRRQWPHQTKLYEWVFCCLNLHSNLTWNIGTQMRQTYLVFVGFISNCSQNETGKHRGRHKKESNWGLMVNNPMPLKDNSTEACKNNLLEMHFPLFQCT